MFGRRKREKAAAEAAREADRRALFAKLAQRPDTVCPFLGMVNDRTAYRDGADDDHRCYAFGDPATLSAEQQTRVCLERGYGNCPRYLRGVLVIPTEELEALRRPRYLPEAPAPPPVPEPARRRRAPLVVIVVLLLLVAGGGGAAWVLFGGDGTAGPAATATASPTPVLTDSPTDAPTGEPTATPDGDATPTPDPTAQPGDVFQFYEVGVRSGDYVLYEVNADGELVRQRGATFSRFSQAPVELVEAPNGLRHWRTSQGEYAGLSYIHEASGDFEIRAVYRRPDGSRSSELLSDDEL